MPGGWPIPLTDNLLLEGLFMTSDQIDCIDANDDNEDDNDDVNAECFHIKLSDLTKVADARWK